MRPWVLSSNSKACMTQPNKLNRFAFQRIIQTSLDQDLPIKEVGIVIVAVTD